MTKQPWNEQYSLDTESQWGGRWIWTMTGILLGALVLLLIYLAGPPMGLLTHLGDQLGTQLGLEEQANTDHRQVSPSATGKIIREESSTPTATSGAPSLLTQGGVLPPFESDTSATNSNQGAAQKPRFTFYKELVDPSSNELTIPVKTSQPTDQRSPQHLPQLDPLAAASPPTAEPAQVVTAQSLTTKPLASAEPAKAKKREKVVLRTLTTTDSLSEQESSSTSLAVKRYLLQTGSFKNQLQADRQRAKLLLEGYNADIRAVTLPSGAVWHRVLMGPFERKEAKQLQARLEASNIATQLRIQN